MSRPRKPTNVLRLSGAFKSNPQRLKQREHEPKHLPPLGDCPTGFTDDEKKAWGDIVRTAPAGVLTQADELAVERCANLLARARKIQFVKNDTTGELYTIPGVTSAEHGQLLQLLGRFGMTPSDRSKVSAQVAEKPTEWKAFG